MLFSFQIRTTPTVGTFSSPNAFQFHQHTNIVNKIRGLSYFVRLLFLFYRYTGVRASKFHFHLEVLLLMSLIHTIAPPPHISLISPTLHLHLINLTEPSSLSHWFSHPIKSTNHLILQVRAKWSFISIIESKNAHELLEKMSHGVAKYSWRVDCFHFSYLAPTVFQYSRSEFFLLIHIFENFCMKLNEWGLIMFLYGVVCAMSRCSCEKWISNHEHHRHMRFNWFWCFWG